MKTVSFLFLTYLFYLVKATNTNFTPECLPTIGMLDASAKIPSGILSGNLIDLGAFDQCLSIKNEKTKIRGKYCVMKLVSKDFPQLPEKYGNIDYEENQMQPEQRLILQGIDPTDNRTGLILGWCIPDKCTPQNFIEPLNFFLKFGGAEIAPVFGGACQTEDNLNEELTPSDWGVISFLIIILVIIFHSTLYDVYLYFQEKRPAHILFTAFSLKTNRDKLLAISKNPDQLPCLNGIRFISMMWVLLGHRYSTAMAEPMLNSGIMLDWVKNSANMYILNAPVSVDSFFVLSGILLSYGFCLAKSKGVSFNIILFYLHRYIRLTPVLGVVVLIHATILDHFGNGPFWQIAVSGFKEPCKKYWWSTLIYIQNYYNPQESCVGQTWYLAVDFQLFLLSPIILIPLWRWPKKTLITSTLLVVGSMISSFIITYHYDLPASNFDMDPIKSQDYLQKYYFATHARFGPWLMGVMLGYCLFTIKKNKTEVKMDTIFVLFGWLTSLTCMLITLFGGHNLVLSHDIVGNSFFNGMHRHGWSLGLCWVIYACTIGYGGFINSFLSWSPFQVLGRFTYTIYLVHLTIMYMMAAASRTSIYFTDFNELYRFWGDFFLSLAIAICLTLAFESPMITIEKVIFRMDTKKDKPILPTHKDAPSKDLKEESSIFPSNETINVDISEHETIQNCNEGDVLNQSKELNFEENLDTSSNKLYKKEE